MLNVILELRCNVCGGDRFMIPTLDEVEQDIRCAECHAFKCHSDSLEKAMAKASAQPRNLNRQSWSRRLAS